MTNVAELSVLLTAENPASRVLQELGKDLDNTHKAMIGVGAAMTAVGAAGLAGFGQAIGVAAEFQKTMSGVKAVMGGEEWSQFGDGLDKLAKQLGKDTVFSAKEAALAIQELMKAGISATDVMDGAAKAVTDLAAAGGVPIKDAAEIASNAMNVFGIAGKDMAGAVDLIAGAVNASSLEMNDFKFALQMSGAVAHVAGVSFRDTAIAIAELGQAGLKGSDAGTSLKTFLVSLPGLSGPAVDELKKLGIVTAEGANQFFDATGKVKGFADIAQVLQTALSGLTEQGKLESLHKAFGTDAMRAAAIFAEQGAAGFEKMAAAMDKVSAAEVAKTKLDNLAGAIKYLQGTIETVQIAIGEKFTAPLAHLGDVVNTVFNAFLELPAPVQNTIVAVGAALTAFAALGGPLLMLAGAMPAIAAGFALMAPAVLAVLAVAAAVALVAAAVTALAVAWTTDFGGIQTTTLRVLENIQPVFDRIGAMLGGMVAGIQDTLVQWGLVWQALTVTTDSGAAGVTQAGNGIIGWFHDTLAPALEWLNTTWGAVWQEVQIQAIYAVNAVLPTLQALGGWLDYTIPKAVSALQETWAAAWNEVGPPLEAFWAAAAPRLADMKDWLGVQIPQALGWFKDRLLDLWGSVGPIIEKIGALYGGFFDLLGTGMHGALAQMQSELVAARPGLATEAVKTGMQFMHLFSEELADGRPALAAEAAQTGTEVTRQFSKALTDADLAAGAAAVGTEAMAGMVEGIALGSPAVQVEIRAAVRAAINAAKAEAAISSPSAVTAAEIGGPMVRGIVLGIAAAQNTLDDAMGSAVNRAVGVAQSTSLAALAAFPSLGAQMLGVPPDWVAQHYARVEANLAGQNAGEGPLSWGSRGAPRPTGLAAGPVTNTGADIWREVPGIGTGWRGGRSAAAGGTAGGPAPAAGGKVAAVQAEQQALQREMRRRVAAEVVQAQAVVAGSGLGGSYPASQIIAHATTDINAEFAEPLALLQLKLNLAEDAAKETTAALGGTAGAIQAVTGSALQGDPGWAKFTAGTGLATRAVKEFFGFGPAAQQAAEDYSKVAAQGWAIAAAWAAALRSGELLVAGMRVAATDIPKVYGVYGPAGGQPTTSTAGSMSRPSGVAPTGAVYNSLGGVIASGSPEWNRLYGGMPHLAQGGVVTRPTMLLAGESGPEAIVPLGRGGMGGGTTVNINVDYSPQVGHSDPTERRKVADQLAGDIYAALRAKGYRVGG